VENRQKYEVSMKKSVMVSGMNFGTEFLNSLYKEVIRLGGNEEQIFTALKTNSKTIPEIAKLIVGTSKLALQYLRLIADGITIVTQPFKKDSFFTKNGPVKLYFWDTFTNWILKAIPNEIPAFEGILSQTELTKSMNDSEILNELNNPKPFTIPEFVAILRDLLTKQVNGESGRLLTNGYANIFYVQLADGRVVVVYASWVALGRGWYLHANGVGDDRWNDGNRVFSRS